MKSQAIVNLSTVDRSARSEVLSESRLGQAIPGNARPPVGDASSAAAGGGTGGGGGGGGPTGGGGPKNQKRPSMMKKFAGKVSTLSGKITELKCVQTQINSCELLYLVRTL